MKLKKGWLKRQIEHAEKDIAGWPEWLRREAGLDRANDDVNCPTPSREEILKCTSEGQQASQACSLTINQGASRKGWMRRAL